MKNRLLIILIMSTAVASCMNSEAYAQKLDSWVGHDISELVNSWGYNTGSFQAPNGNMVYVWENSSSYTTPVQSNSTSTLIGNQVFTNTTNSGGDTFNFLCRTYFEVNSDNTIVSWQFEGNVCR